MLPFIVTSTTAPGMPTLPTVLLCRTTVVSDSERMVAGYPANDPVETRLALRRKHEPVIVTAVPSVPLEGVTLETTPTQTGIHCKLPAHMLLALQINEFDVPGAATKPALHGKIQDWLKDVDEH